MTDEPAIPGNLTANGLTWELYVYNDENRYKWYRALTDEEVQEWSHGLWDSLDDVDASMASPPDYPVVEVELTHEADDSYSVIASRTQFGSGDTLMTNPIGGEYTFETDAHTEAIATVRLFVQNLS